MNLSNPFWVPMKRDTAFCPRGTYIRTRSKGNAERNALCECGVDRPHTLLPVSKRQYATPHEIAKLRMVNYNYIYVKHNCQSFLLIFARFYVISVGFTIHALLLLCILWIAICIKIFLTTRCSVTGQGYASKRLSADSVLAPEKAKILFAWGRHCAPSISLQKIFPDVLTLLAKGAII